MGVTSGLQFPKATGITALCLGEEPNQILIMSGAPKTATELAGVFSALGVEPPVGSIYYATGSTAWKHFRAGTEGSTWAKSAETFGTSNGATVSAYEDMSPVVQTALVSVDTLVTVANTTGASFGGVTLYDFPAGVIHVLGVVAENLSFNWAGQDIAATGSGDFSMGTTITDDATLDGTDVNLLASTALTDPFVAGVGSGKGYLASPVTLDGTTTAQSLNLNVIIDDADVADGASDVVKVNGRVLVTWVKLGDY